MRLKSLETSLDIIRDVPRLIYEIIQTSGIMLIICLIGTRQRTFLKIAYLRDVCIQRSNSLLD